MYLLPKFLDRIRQFAYSHVVFVYGTNFSQGVVEGTVLVPTFQATSVIGINTELGVPVIVTASPWNI